MQQDPPPKRTRSLSADFSGDFSIHDDDGDSRAYEVSTSARSRSSISDVMDEEENRYFGQRESRRVRNVKSLVFLVLFLVTLAVCFIVFFFTTRGQKAEFEAS